MEGQGAVRTTAGKVEMQNLDVTDPVFSSPLCSSDLSMRILEEFI